MKDPIMLLASIGGFILFIITWIYWPIRDDVWDEDIECWCDQHHPNEKK